MRLLATSLAIFLFCFVSSVQAQKKAKKPAAPATKVDVIVQNQELDSPGRIAVKVSDDVTKVRIVSESRDFAVSKNTIDAKSKSFVVDVELEHGDNKFNVIAYKDSSIVYSSPGPVIVSNSLAATEPKKKPPTQNDPVTPDDKTGQAQNDPKKIKLKNPITVSKKSKYDLFLNLADLSGVTDCKNSTIKKCPFKYVINVSNGAGKSTILEVPILKEDGSELAAKTEKPKTDQKQEIELFEGDNFISASAKYDTEIIKGTQSDKLEVKCQNCIESKIAADDSKKIKLNDSAEISNQASYPLKINLADMSVLPKCVEDAKTKCNFKYVIKVDNEDNSKVRKVAIRDKQKFDDKKPVKEQGLKSNAATALPNQPENLFLSKGTNTITVYAELNGEKIDGTQSDSLKVDCKNECSDSGSSTSTRAIVGFEQIGASSAESEQHPFVDFFFSTPFQYGLKWGGRKRSYVTSVWGNVRFSNIPVQNLAAFATFNPGSAVSFIGEDSAKASKLTPTFTALVGIEQRLKPEGVLDLGFLPGKSSLFFIAGGGVINPLKSDQPERIFKIPRDTVSNKILPTFLAQFPEADPDGTFDGVSTINNISFVPVEREKFYRQYFVGFRIKTNFFDSENKPLNLFPAMVDITIGQNEAITNTLTGYILKFDGSTPLPVKGNFLFLYGGLEMKLGKNPPFTPSPFVLEQQTDLASVTNSNRIFVTSDRAPGFLRTRDIFRIGIGIDLFRIFRQNPE